MDLFNIPGVPSTKEQDKNILSKTTKKPSKVVAKAGKSLSERIANIKRSVEENLGEYREKYDCLRLAGELIAYIDFCIKNGICALDTETTGLNPMLDDIVGFSLYTPGYPAVYIPINHIDYMTNAKVSNQLSKEFCKEQLQRLVDNNVKLIMFNAKFDIRVLRHQIGVYLEAYWDGYLAQRLLNENEKENGLKALHNKYVLKGEKDAFAFSDLFEKMSFALVPINSGYIYAARDAEVTYELYKYQEQFLDKNNQKCIDKELTEVADVFRNIEMPLINVVADMEDNGVLLDLDYANQLSEYYNNLLVEKEAEFYKLCDKYNDKIEEYRRKNPNNKLGSMINIASSTQIAILLYDILGEKPVPRQPIRGTGEEVLKAINNEFCKVILEYRGIAKLLSTYIDKLPEVINPNDGKIHASFNQYGTQTGRFSSTDPNLQNIPAHDDSRKDIRPMFTAGNGRIFISSDYSQQEPRSLASLAQDKTMMNAYFEGKDMYSEVASKVYKVPYEDCLEFNSDGSKNPDGKKRRKSVKGLFLGITYGMSVNGVADNLKITVPEAQKFWNDFYREFPKVKQYIENMQEKARIYGFVETAWGRKRRLPNMQLEPYEFDFSNYVIEDFDPLSFDNGNAEAIRREDEEKAINYFTIQLDKAYGRVAKEQVKAKAREMGIIIKDNGGYIADAERQCVNSIIQGTAADMTKLAMIKIGTNKRLKELDCHLAIQVHDEVIVDCPKENAKECAKIVTELMISSAREKIKVPMKCDAEFMESWK